MRRRFWRAFESSRVFRTAVVLSIFAGIAWLDRDGCVVANQSAVFAWVITVIGWVVDAAVAVEAAVQVSITVAVSWLFSAFGWLAGRIITIAKGTGVIFSKTWDGLRVVWRDVVKPGLVWFDDKIRRFHDWLLNKFRPVFRFLDLVRAHLNAIYRRFVQPVLDTIDFIHQFNRLLHVFHIHVLDSLDDALQRLELAINQRVEWIYGRLNELTNWLNRIVDGDGFFQRYMLLRSLVRDVVYSWRILINSGMRDLTEYEVARLHRSFTTLSVPELVHDILKHRNGEHTDAGDVVDALATQYATLWESSSSGGIR